MATALFTSLLAFAGAATEGTTTTERRWTIHVDNDLFAFADRDRDYTAGVSFALEGERAREHALSLSRWLDGLDAFTRVARLRDDATRRGDAFELGLLLFTPHDLAAEEAIHDDRPYANLVYGASSTLFVNERRGTALQSTLALGALGLPFAGSLHRGLHEITGSVEPRGYGHQISDGGEPTFLYAVSRYRRLRDGRVFDQPYALRFGFGGSVGYVTEANAEIAVRTHAAWWSSSPAAGEIGGHPQIDAAAPYFGSGPRVSFDAGARVHVRSYNAFLEGQTKRSDVTFDSSELEPVLLHLWAGVTTTLRSGLSVSYTFHRQTQEIETRRGGRSFTWASIGVAQRF